VSGTPHQKMRDLEAVTARLGRVPSAAFEVVVRDAAGAPAVIRNAPFLTDGTPMPTMYWLVDPEVCRQVGRLESMGGVRLAEAAVPPEAVAEAHRRHAEQRGCLVPADHHGPVPIGGVGGTRAGVKCLHAHLAWWLAGGADPVGAWTASMLGPDGLPTLAVTAPTAAAEAGERMPRTVC